MIKFIRNLRLLRYAVMVVRNPDRLENVLALSQDLSDPSEAQRMLNFYQSYPETAHALIDKPRLSLQQEPLAFSSNDSLGRRYVAFLSDHGLNPKALDVETEGRADAYILTHLYETHDLWHVVTGFDTSVAGELGLQAFYAAQSPALFPVAILALGLLNTLLFARDDYEQRLDAITKGWTMGRKSKAMFGIAWNDHWNRPLIDIRQELGIAVS